MKMRLLLCTIIACLFLVGCPKEGTTSKRTRQEIDTFIAQNKLSDTDKANLLNGEYTIGMSAKAVRFMLGEPDELKQIKQPWATQEEWFYKKGQKKRFIIENSGVVDLYIEE